MKALIAVSTCNRDREQGLLDVIRETWAKGDKHGENVGGIQGLDYKLFLGEDATFIKALDEVRLAVPDDYLSLAYKTKEAHRWALNYGYDWVFQTFSDVYVRPERLWEAVNGYSPDKEYIGFAMIDPATKLPYASGGAGYWLNARLSKLLIEKDAEDDWAEDRWTGQAMFDNRVTLWHDPRYSPWPHPCLKRNDHATAHLSRGTGKFDKQWMLNTHKFWTLSQSV